MLSLNDYVSIVLKKKKWTNRKFCEEINKIEKRLGDTRTREQNISRLFTNEYNISPKTLVKYELALQLPFGTLLNMSPNGPVSKQAKKELQDLIEKVRD